MRRMFGIDVLACRRCGGRFRLIPLIEGASVIEGILRHLHVPTDVPTPRPGRAPPPMETGWLNQDTHDVSRPGSRRCGPVSRPRLHLKPRRGDCLHEGGHPPSP
jgi:hypothetical protein